MSTSAVASLGSLQIDLHGTSLLVRSDHERVLSALASRFAPFVCDRSPAADEITFDIHRRAGTDGPADHIAPGPGRVVYDSELGDVFYRDGDDVMTIDCGIVRVDADLDRRFVTIRYATGTDEELALAVHPLFTLPLLELLKRQHRYSLHAACVASGDNGLLIAGASGSGKTTMSVAMTLDGMSFLSDDMVFLTEDPDRPRVLGFPDELDLTDDTVRLFPALGHLEGRPTWGGRPKHQLRADEGLSATIALDCQPRALVFPRITGHRSTVIEPCTAADALVELAPNVLLTQAESTQRHLDALGLLVRTVPTFRMGLGTDLGQAVEVLREVMA